MTSRQQRDALKAGEIAVVLPKAWRSRRRRSRFILQAGAIGRVRWEEVLVRAEVPWCRVDSLSNLAGEGGG
eukprot:365608-Chlamydomonas_euryale.AAC.13